MVIVRTVAKEKKKLSLSFLLLCTWASRNLVTIKTTMNVELTVIRCENIFDNNVCRFLELLEQKAMYKQESQTKLLYVIFSNKIG